MLKVSSLTFGGVLTALGCYGVFDYLYGLEGHRITFLVVAGVVVAALPSVTPHYGEEAWRRGRHVTAILFGILFLMTATLVIYMTRDRVHSTTAATVAERGATRGAYARAEVDLTEAKRKADRAEADVKACLALPREPASTKAKDGSWCDGASLARWKAAAAEARTRVREATEAANGAQGKAIDDGNPPPAWLLPLCIDFGGFLLLSFGFAIPWRQEQNAVAVETKAEPVAVIEVKAEPVLELKPELPVAIKAKRQRRKAKSKGQVKVRLPKTTTPSVTAAAQRAAAVTFH